MVHRGIELIISAVDPRLYKPALILTARGLDNNPALKNNRVTEIKNNDEWIPVSDRKIRVGIIGYGGCKFGAQFGFQNHCNVEVIAVALNLTVPGIVAEPGEFELMTGTSTYIRLNDYFELVY
jgi:hypothetical protein